MRRSLRVVGGRRRVPAFRQSPPGIPPARKGSGDPTTTAHTNRPAQRPPGRPLISRCVISPVLSPVSRVPRHLHHARPPWFDSNRTIARRPPGIGVNASMCPISFFGALDDLAPSDADAVSYALGRPVLRVVALGIDDELLEADCHFQMPADFHGCSSGVHSDRGRWPLEPEWTPVCSGPKRKDDQGYFGACRVVSRRSGTFRSFLWFNRGTTLGGPR